MREMRRKRELFPRWNMPSDPVKAVFWFFHWLLRVLVRFFFILILIGVIYEILLNSRVGGVLNGIVAGVVTLLIGLGVWGGLALLLLFVNVSTNVSQVFSEVNRMQRSFQPRRSPFYTTPEPDMEGKVVEGTVTNLEEERKKRRQE